MNIFQNGRKEIHFVLIIFILIAVLIIGSKINTLHQIGVMKKDTKEIFEFPFQISNAALIVQSEVYKMHRDMKDIVLSVSDEELERKINEVNTHERHVYDYLSVVREKVRDEKGKQLERQTRELSRAWKPIRDEVVELVRGGHRAEAIAITKGKGAKQVLELEHSTSALYQYANNEAHRFKNHSNAMHSQYYLISLVNGAAVLLLLFIIAYFTLNRLSRYISKSSHLTDVLSVIRNVNQLIVREKDVPKLIQEICDILIANRVYSNAWIILYDQGQKANYIASTDTSENFTAIKNKMDGGWIPPCVHSETDRSKGYLIIESTKESCPQCPFADMYENKGAFSIQIKHNDKLYGNLTLSVNAAYLKDDEELSLLQEVASDIAYALYNLETEEHLKTRECSLYHTKELYENIIDSVDNIIFVKDTDFTYTVCNQAFEKFVGKSNDEIVGKTDYELFDKEVADFFREHDTIMLAEKRAKANFEWVTYPDGRKVYLFTVKSPLINAEGELLGLVGNSADLTEQKNTEDALKESEERFTLMMRQSPSVIELYDLEGTQIEVNRAYEELWGFPAEQTLHTFNLFKSTEVEKTGLLPYIQRAYNGEIVQIPPYKYDPTGPTEASGLGRKRWLKTRIYPLKESSGAVKNIVITHEDVTEEITSKNALRKSQENYQLLTENALDMIWKMDMELTFTYVNPTVKALLGYEIEEFIGTKLNHHFSPEEFKKAHEIISEIVRTNSEEGASLEIAMYKKDGTTVPLEVNGKLIFDENHTPIGFQGSARDFTAQTEARKKLNELLAALEIKSKELQTILQEAPNPIMLHNENGEVVMVNRVWQSLSGYTYDEINTVDKWAELACSKNKPLMNQYMDSIYSLEHKIDMGEASVNTKDGNTLIWQFSSAPLGIIDGKRTIVTTAMDITELKKKDEMMMAQSRHAAMGEMIGMIAHQWRQPIASIAMDANNMLLDIAFETFDNTSAAEYTQDILDQTNHLSKTIDDFRNFFKPDKSVSAVNLESIFEETLAIVKESLASHSIALKTSYLSNTLVNAFPRELMQVFVNIINNAKDSLVSNHIQNALIEIKVYDEEKYVCAEICDNGGGIDTTIMPKIFDPYFSTKDEKTGTGLGLYMSKMIIEEHLHGFIDASNNKDGGACFTIRLLKNHETDHQEI
ncbi:multi-sensor signal transduction histidine kinase [Sulfuricurvum kujiense DSM 16994]|uniref:histidine kinase n=1 Tax=Sulfuricurvum kujiense (strain ATCC BAA-921 / DSM 16994 / JCM 11577 / YK-1) TaxID=709032 RepID=E4TZ88_SULKY|nr:PAS domain S-box protein [Sulfuricurvum kujiense]ADR34103.1 multi-sensor signal transduction histidine kinase [Sulfuricurvum kujiense DSM 16994]